LVVPFVEARCIQFPSAIGMQLNLNATTQQLHCVALVFSNWGRAGVKKTQQLC
jgi:hypothetical protein